jgi:hypothetical protein
MKNDQIETFGYLETLMNMTKVQQMGIWKTLMDMTKMQQMGTYLENLG